MKKIVNVFLLTTGIALFSFYNIGCTNNIDLDEYDATSIEYDEAETEHHDDEQDSKNSSARSMTKQGLIGITTTAHENFEKSGKKDSSKGDKGHRHIGRSDKSKHNK